MVVRSGSWRRWLVAVAALVVATGVVVGVGLWASGSKGQPVAVGGGAGPDLEPDPVFASAAEAAGVEAGAPPEGEADSSEPGFVVLSGTELTWLDEHGLPTQAVLPDPQFEPRSYAGSYSPRIADSGDGSLLYAYVEDEVMVDGSSSWSDAGLSEGDPIGTPTLRRIDADGESTFASGGATFAVSDDGRPAYVRGVVPYERAGSPYVGDVVVTGADGSTEVWSRTALSGSCADSQATT